jgi:hypothetical protein
LLAKIAFYFQWVITSKSVADDRLLDFMAVNVNVFCPFLYSADKQRNFNKKDNCSALAKISNAAGMLNCTGVLVTHKSEYD